MSRGTEQIIQPIEGIRSYVAGYCRRPVHEVDVVSITGDASTRQYFRAVLADGRTYVVAHYPEPFDSETLNYCDVTRLFLKAGLPVPILYDASGPRGMIIQEDLGDLRMQDWMGGAGGSRIELAYRRAIDLVIQIQEATDLARTIGSVASRLAFDEEKLMWEMNFFSRHYFGGYRGITLPDEHSARLEAEFKTLAAELAALPRVLCHRDFHSRNLMVRNGALVIIDHQDARLGPSSYDVVSLLEDPYADLPHGMIERLRNFFIEGCLQSVKLSRDPTWRERFSNEYHLMAVQRLVKAIGTYAYQTAVLGNDVYIPYIPRARQRAVTAMQAIGRFSHLRQLLTEEDGR